MTSEERLRLASLIRRLSEADHLGTRVRVTWRADFEHPRTVTGHPIGYRLQGRVNYVVIREGQPEATGILSLVPLHEIESVDL